jgi:hypothetical protein
MGHRGAGKRAGWGAWFGAKLGLISNPDVPCPFGALFGS